MVASGRVVVATENNSVYAFDAARGARLWMTHLGDPVDASSLPCGNIRPISGITGTPVVDVARGLIYAVAFLKPAHHELYALSLEDGSVRFHQEADPPGETPSTHQQRAALALSGDLVYVAYGGLLGDCGRYHGNLVGIPAGGGAGISYRVPCGRACGIWATSGPAVDDSGQVFVATGNSDSTSSFDYGESVIRLSPSLGLLDYFAPADWAALNRADQDLGSTGPALLPGGKVYVSGKSPTGYLLDAGRLGGIGGQVASSPLPCGTFGGTAYAASTVYAACPSGIFALRIDGAAMSLAWQRKLGDDGAPIAFDGAVWVVDVVAGVLYALDPAGGATRFQMAVGSVQHFTTLAAIPGRAFVVGSRQLRAVEVDSS